MKKIGITLDFVIRDYLTKLKNVYMVKYDTEPLRIESLENLYQYFPMTVIDFIEDINDEEGNPLPDGLTRTIQIIKDDNLCIDEPTFDKFVLDFAYEIYGTCNEVVKNAMSHVNILSNELKLKGYELVLISDDNGLARGSTLFFLAKTLCLINNIMFTDSLNPELSKYHTIITANEKYAKSKRVIKIKNEFNDNFLCKKEFNSIKDINVKNIFSNKLYK